jgi:hypothetical protein
VQPVEHVTDARRFNDKIINIQKLCESHCDPVFEILTKDGEPIEDGAHETLTIESSAYTPRSVIGESAALTLKLTQTAGSECEENSWAAVVELRFCLGNIGRRVGRQKSGLTQVSGHG